MCRWWLRWFEAWTCDLADNQLARIARVRAAKALVFSLGVIRKLTYGRAGARADVLPGNIEEVASEDDVGDADMAAKVGNSRTCVIRNRGRKDIQGEILVVLANDDILRAFRYDPVPTLRAVKTPQLWILGEDDLEAPSAETSCRVKTLIAEGKPITLALFPHAEHGMTEYEFAVGLTTTLDP